MRAFLVLGLAALSAPAQDSGRAFGEELSAALRRPAPERSTRLEELAGRAPWRAEGAVLELLDHSLDPAHEERALADADAIAEAVARASERTWAREDVARRRSLDRETLERWRAHRTQWRRALELANAGDWGLALEAARGAVASADALGVPHLAARARQTLGRMLADSGDPAAAARELETAARLHRARGARGELARDEAALSEALRHLGRPRAALERARAALVAVAGSDEPLPVSALSLGELCATLGEYDEAAAWLARAGSAVDPRERARAELARAALEGGVGHYAAALRALDAAGASARAGGDRQLVLRALHARAATLSEVGRGAEAEAELEREVGSEDRAALPLEAAYLDLQLGVLRLDGGRPEAALEALERASSAFAGLNFDAGGDDAAQQRARALLELGRASQALDAYRAVALRHRELARPFPLALALTGEGDALARLGRWHEAEAAYARALESGAALDSPEARWRASAGLGRAREELGDEPGALEASLAALEDLEAIRGALEVAELRARYLDDKLALHARAARLLARAGRVAEAFRWVEAAKARTLSELARGGQPAPAGAAGEAERRLALLELAIAGARRAGDAATVEGLRAERDAARAAVEAQALSDALADPRRRALAGEAPPPDLTEVRCALPLDAALVEYALGERAGLALVVRPEGAWAVELATDLATVEDLVARLEAPARELRAGRTDLANLGFDAAAAATLYEALVAPLAARLAGVEVVLVVPDGALWRAPLAALVRARQERPVDPAHPYAHLAGCRFWVQDVALGVLPSARLLLDPRPTRDAGEGPALVVVDPAPTPDDAPRLVAARLEAEAVERALAAAGHAPRVLRGAQATEAAFRAAAPGARWIHVIAHGERVAPSPWASRLALAAGEGDDGWLHAFELERLALGADEVVLSTCESAGPTERSEGFLGLPRALLAAGARTVVADHWAIEDRAAAFVMARLVRERARGADPPHALRAAQLACLAGAPDAREAWVHPFFWAGYTAVGAP